MTSRIRASVDAMTGYTPGEQPRGGLIVKLNTNENPYPPSPAVSDALRTLDPDDLRRYPDPDSSALRQRIAEIHECDPEQVFVGNGSDEVLALCTRCFVENDGSIGYFDPSYSLYPVLTSIRDVEHRPVELTDAFGWQMPADYACSLFFLANPNAPTGMTFAPATIRSFCQAHSGVVVVDEAYADFAVTNCVALATELDNVVVSRTLSKSFSLAGLRLGYALGHRDLIGAMMKAKDSYNVDTLSQYVGLAALSDLFHMQANVVKVKNTRVRLVRALDELGFDVCPPQGNFVWARPTRLDAESLYLQLKEKKILVRYFPGERTGEYVRITVGTDEDIDRMLRAMEELMTDSRTSTGLEDRV